MGDVFFERCDLCDAQARGICGACCELLGSAPLPPGDLGLDHSFALFAYEGAGRELIHRLKFRHRRASLKPLTQALGRGLLHLELGSHTVVAVPAHAKRRRDRGFDLADLLAERLSTQLGLSRSYPLVRKDLGTQQHRGRVARAEVTYQLCGPAGPRVLLVDDVVTTGATLRSCATALRSAGTEHIVAMTLAVTPDMSPTNLTRREATR